jgi:hypothetical protein
VLESHAWSISDPFSLRLGRARKIWTRTPPQPPERPEEDEAEDQDSNTDLDHATSRLATFGDELPGRDDAARRSLPGAVGSTREQQTDRLVSGTEQIAVGPRRAANQDSGVDVTLDALVDFDGEHTLRCSPQAPRPLVDNAAYERGIGVVETLGKRSVDAYTRLRRGRENERPNDDAEKRRTTHFKRQRV